MGEGMRPQAPNMMIPNTPRSSQLCQFDGSNQCVEGFESGSSRNGEKREIEEKRERATVFWCMKARNKVQEFPKIVNKSLKKFTYSK